MEVSAKLKDCSGDFLLKSAIMITIAALTLSAAIAVYHVYHVIGSVRDKVNEAVLAVASVNVPEFYGGARDSDGFARHQEDGSFTDTITTDAVVDQLAQSLGATDLSDDDTITVGTSYTVSRIDTQCFNSSGNNLNFHTKLTVTVPLSVGGLIPTSIIKTIEVKTSYDPRF